MADKQAQDGMSGDQGGTPEPESFDAWLEGQDETVRGLIDGHTKGLKSALETERNNAKALTKEIRELSGRLDQNSDTARQLTELSGKLETEQKRADFYEAATAAGCRNLRLAWLAASTDELTLDETKAQYPDLFESPRAATTNAGRGAQQPGGGATRDMNMYIRAAAGRR